MIVTLRQYNFTLLWLGGIISNIGDWILVIGLPVYVYMETGSALATSIMLAVSFIPGMLFGSLAGVFVDRWDRRWTMIISNLFLAAGLLPILFVHSQATLWILYVALFLESCFDQFVTPAESALIPHLVKEDLLVHANALKSIGFNSSRFIGGAIGGVIMATWGLRGVVLIDAVSFLFVATMIWFIKVSPGSSDVTQVTPVPTDQPLSGSPVLYSLKNLMNEWLEGWQLLLRQRTLSILLIMYSLQRIGEGVFSVLLIVFVEQVLKGGAVDYGLLLSVQAIGSLIGGVVIGMIGGRIALARMLGICTLLFGIIDLLIIDIPLFFPLLWILILLFIVIGIPNTGSLVGFQALMQTLVEDKLLGRAFGVISSVGALLTLLGMILAGILGDRLGPVLPLNLQGGMYAFSGLLVIFTLWNLKTGTQTNLAAQPAIQELQFSDSDV